MGVVGIVVGMVGFGEVVELSFWNLARVEKTHQSDEHLLMFAAVALGSRPRVS